MYRSSHRIRTSVRILKLSDLVTVKLDNEGRVVCRNTAACDRNYDCRHRVAIVKIVIQHVCDIPMLVKKKRGMNLNVCLPTFDYRCLKIDLTR